MSDDKKISEESCTGKCESPDVPKPEESRILQPGQDPRTVDLDAKVRAEKCWQAVQLVCKEFNCNLEGVAIIKNGSVQTAIACQPNQVLSEEQLAAVKAAQAVGGVPK